MRKPILKLALCAVIATVVSCSKTVQTPTGTVSLDLPATPYSYFYGSYGDTLTNHKATLGRVLFYDGRLSLNNTISCASCHKQAYGFADNAAFSTGYEGRVTGRNSKGFTNLLGKSMFFSTDMLRTNGSVFLWDGRENNLKNLVARPITNHVEMGITDPADLPAKLKSVAWYAPLFKNAYPDGEITADRISECIATFMASIRSTNSKFDRYIVGDVSAFNAQEIYGYNLFNTKYNCSTCHQIFTNSYSQFTAFADIGLDQNYTDKGRGTISRSAADYGKFRIPSLENVALTAPYMHDGRFKTLGEVIDHYSQGINYSSNLDDRLKTTDSSSALRMNISDAEKAALIAFLNTMTDYSTITNVIYSNPFKVSK